MLNILCKVTRNGLGACNKAARTARLLDAPTTKLIVRLACSDTYKVQHFDYSSLQRMFQTGLHCNLFSFLLWFLDTSVKIMTYSLSVIAAKYGISKMYGFYWATLYIILRHIRRLSGSGNLYVQKQYLVFDTFINFQPM